MTELLFRRTVNVKFLGCLIGIALLFGTGVHFLHGFQVRRNASGLLSQADRTEKEGDYPQTKEFLKRYLELAPHDAPVRARYAILLADEQKFGTSPVARGNALQALDDALRLDPNRNDLRRLSIDIALKLPFGFSLAAQHLDRLIQASPNNATLEALRAVCYEGTGDYKKARKGFSDAISHAPQIIENYSRLAYLLRQHTRDVTVSERSPEVVIQLANSKIEEMVRVNERSYEAHLMRARYLKTFGDLTKNSQNLKTIEEDLRKARKLAPDAADVLLAIAESARERHDPQEARAALQRGIQLYPGDWLMYRALAQLEFEQGKTDAAQKCLREGLRRLPHQIELLWNLGLFLVLTNHDGPETADIIDRLRTEGFPEADLEFLHGRSLFLKGSWLAAIRVFERIYSPLIDRNNEHKDLFGLNLAQDASLHLGYCYEQLGDAQRAASAFHRVLSRDPRSVAGHLGVARMEWALGQFDLAADEYRQLLILPGAPPQALVELAHVLILINFQKPQAERANLAIWNEPDQVLQRAEKLKEVPIEVPLLRADILFAIAEVLTAEGQVEKAHDQLVQARRVLLQGHLDKKARPAEIWVAEASLAERQGNLKAALALLEEAERFLGDRVELRLAKARFWVRQKGTQASTGIASLSKGLERFKAEEWSRLVRGLAAAHQQLGDNAEAARLWQQLAEKLGFENDLTSRISLFDLALQDYAAAMDSSIAGAKETCQRQDQRMSRLIQEIKTIEGEDGTLWRYCQACQIILKARARVEENRRTMASKVPADRKKAWQDLKTILGEASELLDKVASQRSAWPRVPVCQAQIQELRGNPDGAIAKYQQAVVMGERNPAVIRRAVELLSARQRFPEADQMLQRLGEQAATFSGLERVAAEVALRKHDNVRALDLAQKAVSDDSKDFRDYLWLGQIQAAAGQPDETPFRRAVALAGDAPAAWVGYVRYLVRIGDKQKAEVIIHEAELKLPKNKAPLALAQCYSLLGKSQLALELYQKALRIDKDDLDAMRSIAVYHLSQNHPEKARPYLEQIIQVQNKENPGATEWAEWARRVLALALIARGDMQERQKALVVLGLLENTDAGERSQGEGVDSERIRAVALASRPGLREHQKAIQVLEKLRRDQTASASDQFLLAQLYEAAGAWPKAKDQLINLLIVEEEGLAKAPSADRELWTAYAHHLAHFTHRILAHAQEDSTQAHRYLLKLEKLQPNAFRTLALKARIQARQGRGADAVPAIVAHVQNKPELLEPAAALLEQIEQIEAAREMYKRFADQSDQPEAKLALARFYGRQNQVALALSLCERALKDCPPETVGQSAVMVLSTSKPTAEHRQRVAGWLENAIRKAPQNAKLLDELAVVRNLQGNHSEMIELYRRIVKQDGSNTKAMNNLAWLLAFQEGKGREAMEVIQHAIDLGGPHASRLNTRAVVYLALGQSELARKDLEEVLEIDPTSAPAHFRLARAYHQAKDRNAARHEFDRANALGLTEAKLDPLERRTYIRLRNELTTQ